jgi:hypothetical protein
MFSSERESRSGIVLKTVLVRLLPTAEKQRGSRAGQSANG